MVLLRAFHRSVIVLTSALAAAIRSFCEVGCWMMRVRHVDDVLHECAAIAGRPVPVIGDHVDRASSGRGPSRERTEIGSICPIRARGTARTACWPEAL